MHAVRARLVGTILALATMVGLGIVANPVPAMATSTCTSWSDYYDGFGINNVPSVGYDSYNTNCLLYRGNYNDGVGALQGALDYCYGKGLAVDNDFGPLTQAALKQVQYQLHISVDGVYGPQTREAMNWPWFYSIYPLVYTCHRLSTRSPQ
jgi:hypothetical protein